MSVWRKSALKFLAALAAVTLHVFPRAFCEERAALVFSAGAPAPELDALFQRKDGWIGADGAFSVALSPEKTLWLFSDTWLGEVRGGKRTHVSMINNSVGVQSGRGADAKLEFATRTGADGKAASVIEPADGRGFFWLNAGVLANERLYIFLAQVEKTAEPGAFGFRQFAQKLGVVANPNDAPAQWRVEQIALPCTEFSASRTLTFGAAAMLDGDYLYVYGIDEELKGRQRGKHMILARVKSGQIADTTAWRFYRDGVWQEDFRACSHLAKGYAAEYSVSYLPAFKSYVSVYTEGGMSRKIVARTAAAPWGSWSEPALLYECPEMAASKKVFCYAAKAHPMLAGENELVISYVANAFELGTVLNDASLYWPRFVRVKVAARGAK